MTQEYRMREWGEHFYDKGPKLSIHSRRTQMTKKDWRDFTDGIAEAFPGVRYYFGESGHVYGTPEPPDLRMTTDFFSEDKPKNRDSNIYLVFDPDWKPDYLKYYDSSEPDKWWWTYENPPRPQVRFYMETRPRAREELPKDGIGGYNQIDFYANPDNKEHVAMRGKFFRLFGRYASNRNQIWFNQKKPGEVTLKKSGSSFYMGNDLRDWLREDPEREWVFNYPSACRPAD